MLSNEEIVKNIILGENIKKNNKSCSCSCYAKKYSNGEISVNNIMHDIESGIFILTDRQLENLWLEFGDTCIDEEECIDTNFFIWSEGTHREDIWHWFDRRHSKGVFYLLYDLDAKRVEQKK